MIRGSYHVSKTKGATRQRSEPRARCSRSAERARGARARAGLPSSVSSLASTIVARLAHEGHAADVQRLGRARSISLHPPPSPFLPPMFSWECSVVGWVGLRQHVAGGPRRPCVGAVRSVLTRQTTPPTTGYVRHSVDGYCGPHRLSALRQQPSDDDALLERSL